MKSKKSEKTSKDYYVNPEDMWGEFNSFYNKIEESDSPDDVEMSPQLGKMIDDIATKLGFMGRFINYSYKDEMIGDARIKMVKAVYDRNFSLWGTNFCTPIYNESGRDYVFVYTWSREKKEWLNKKVYLKEWDVVNTLPSSAEFMDLPVTYVDEKTGTILPILNTITMKNNPFSYFTKVAYHAFVNRIKKEQKVAEILAAYQEKVYEEIYSSGNGWENVKRSPIEDENEYFYEMDSSEFFDEDHAEAESPEEDLQDDS